MLVALRKRDRAGITLVEVLVALFTTALGLMAILTLFPLGAANIAQAIKDDRTAHAAHVATVQARVLWRRALEQTTNTTNGIYEEPFVTALDNPNKSNRTTDLPAAQQKSGYTALNGTETTWSYPVLVDPIGFNNQTGLPQYWACESNPAQTPAAPGLYCIPRRTLNSAPAGTDANAQRLRLQATTMLDDLTFGKNGAPPSAALERLGKYSWAYLFQRHDNSRRKEVHLTVLMFSSRIPDLANTEARYPATFSRNQATITYNGTDRPPLRKGGWVMDSTITPTNPNVYFYRIEAITETSPTQMTFDIRPESQRDGSGTLVVFDNLVEVFPRGLLTDISVPAP